MTQLLTVWNLSIALDRFFGALRIPVSQLVEWERSKMLTEEYNSTHSSIRIKALSIITSKG
jgi:hypothetical protein